MYGLTRATTTLVFSAAAGLLIWLATQISNDQIGGYWARVGLVAGAGLLMALSQLLGGWTKWGWPRLSIAVLTTAFVPVAIVTLWIVLAGEPGSGWFHNHVLAWSRDIHVSGLVTDFLYYIPVLVFGTGLGCITVAFVDRWADLAPHPGARRSGGDGGSSLVRGGLSRSVRANRSDSFDAAHDRFRRALPARSRQRQGRKICPPYE